MPTIRKRCKQCTNMYQTQSKAATKCSVCNGTNTTVNGNRITGLKPDKWKS